METFARTYFSTKPAFLAHQDAAFVLSYSIVMLNTDQVYLGFFSKQRQYQDNKTPHNTFKLNSLAQPTSQEEDGS